MYRDNTLLPKEGIRLAALGLLADAGPMPYADLAASVRQFTSYYWGPTLDVMSSSLELMRIEGLIAAEGGGAGDHLATRVAITEAGRAALQTLLRASVRSHATDFNKLVVALKLRYLHLLPPAEQRDQVEALIEAKEAERARLLDLRARQAGAEPGFAGWVEHDIRLIETDMAWLNGLLGSLPAA
jgi:DNA-binding PadR family transcriptional regulator